MSNNNGPTLNPSYNRTLAKWAASGDDCTPECEDCGKNLSGLNVVETAYGWFCESCAEPSAPRCERSKSRDLNYVSGGYAKDSSGNYREAFWAGTP